jgi:hypothetical protein
MKLGISMLVVGLVLAGLGVFVWQFASGGGLAGHPVFSLPQDIATVEAIGMGLTVVGGGLSIGGIVRMVIKR